MNTLLAPSDHVRLAAVATRARVAANVCRNRFAAPGTIRALRFIAAHLDTAADVCDGRPASLTNVVRPVADAQQLMSMHPDARLPGSVFTYIMAPLAPASTLPLPVPLTPLQPRHASQEKALRDDLLALHADTRAADEDTEGWFTSVLTVLARWTRLAGEVDVENRRPCNRQALIATHIGCPECSGHDISLHVNNWAICSCGYGDTWAAFRACYCFGLDCPAIRALNSTT
ncbi:hypothetical protein [Streptomyces sp. NPDC091278]|uniref:hypothetical protein n=1 Tax=Streptomyces sp. NPDC091278 TaxID=3155301 RepID=UPI00344BBFB0